MRKEGTQYYFWSYMAMVWLLSVVSSNQNCNTADEECFWSD